jgi:hypothetical protein
MREGGSWRAISHKPHFGIDTNDTDLDSRNVFVNMFWILGPSASLSQAMPSLRIRFMVMVWNPNRTGLSGWLMVTSTALIQCLLIIQRETFYGIGFGQWRRTSLQATRQRLIGV